jgi:nitrogen regulatory protein P-II 1
MKSIDVIIKPSKLEDVKKRIREVGVNAMTLSTVTNCGGTDARLRIYRGSSFFVDSDTRARVQIIVEEEMVGPVVEAIVATASPGEMDAGTISIYPVTETIRIQADARSYVAGRERQYDHAKVA